MSEQSTVTQPLKTFYAAESRRTDVHKANIIDKDSNATTLSQRVAICFGAGVLGALAVLLFSHVLSLFGPGPKGPIPFPASFEPPGIYRPLFWGGLWGLLFGFFIKPVWNRLYLAGFLYFLVQHGSHVGLDKSGGDGVGRDSTRGQFPGN